MSELAKVARIPRSSYYYHAKRQSAIDKYGHAKSKIEDIFNNNYGRYGYRRITAALHEQGIGLNHKTVQRLMKALGLYCAVRLKKYRSYKGSCSSNVAPNLLNRNFVATRPNEKWVTDITEIKLCGKKIYLSPILDLYNGEVISYNISYHPKFTQVTDMLIKAFQKIPDGTSLILHSDQGWQYHMEVYQSMLRERGIRQSMSRKGNCYDNAVMENFFGLMKSELLYLTEFSSPENFIQELHHYIHYYNFHRSKSRLKYQSPVNYRLMHSQVA